MPSSCDHAQVAGNDVAGPGYLFRSQLEVVDDAPDGLTDQGALLVGELTRRSSMPARIDSDS